MKRILLIGATGSLGSQTLDIIARYRDEFQIVGISADKNAEKLIELADRFQVPKLYLNTTRLSEERAISSELDFLQEPIDLLMLLDHGLQSHHLCLEAIARGIPLAIANKELLIVHGQDICYLAQEMQVPLIPLDSEHNALYQLLQGKRSGDVRRVILTASGGPFRDRSYAELEKVGIKEVLQHPNWRMGAKTTVDSATLVNKAYEVIETAHLFDLSLDQIEVRLHPESIIHAIVEYHDGTSQMLAYPPDMDYPLAHALFHPSRAPIGIDTRAGELNFDQPLHFQSLEAGRFPCFDFVLKIAREAPQSLLQLVQNDERIVKDFLNNEIGFHDILAGLKENIL